MSHGKKHQDEFEVVARALVSDDFAGSQLIFWLGEQKDYKGSLSDFSIETSLNRTTINQEVVPELVRSGLISIRQSGKAELTENGKKVEKIVKHLLNR
jgi:hypothetical protein